MNWDWKLNQYRQYWFWTEVRSGLSALLNFRFRFFFLCVFSVISCWAQMEIAIEKIFSIRSMDEAIENEQNIHLLCEYLSRLIRGVRICVCVCVWCLILLQMKYDIFIVFFSLSSRPYPAMLGREKKRFYFSVCLWWIFDMNILAHKQTCFILFFFFFGFFALPPFIRFRSGIYENADEKMRINNL